MDILKYFKLITGEWVIGKLVEDNEEEGHFVLERVRVVRNGTDTSGNIFWALLPFEPTDPQGEILFTDDAIIAVPEEITDELRQAYLQATTEIALAQAH